VIDKSADTQYLIQDLLQRWSPLAFSEQLVEPEKLRVLEATMGGFFLQ